MTRKLLQNYRVVPPATFDSIGHLVEYAEETPTYDADHVNLAAGHCPSEVHFHQHNYISHHVENVRVWMSWEPGLIPTREGFIVVLVIVLFLLFAPELISALAGWELPKK